MHLKTISERLRAILDLLGNVLAPTWPILAPYWAVLSASWPPQSLPKLVQKPSWGPHKTRSNIDPNLESLGGPKTLKFLKKNKYFYKPDSTWNGKRRFLFGCLLFRFVPVSFPFRFLFRSRFVPKTYFLCRNSFKK